MSALKANIISKLTLGVMDDNGHKEAALVISKNYTWKKTFKKKWIVGSCLAKRS